VEDTHIIYIQRNALPAALALQRKYEDIHGKIRNLIELDLLNAEEILF